MDAVALVETVALLRNGLPFLHHRHQPAIFAVVDIHGKMGVAAGDIVRRWRLHMAVDRAEQYARRHVDGGETEGGVDLPAVGQLPLGDEEGVREILAEIMRVEGDGHFCLCRHRIGREKQHCDQTGQFHHICKSRFHDHSLNFSFSQRAACRGVFLSSRRSTI